MHQVPQLMQLPLHKVLIKVDMAVVVFQDPQQMPALLHKRSTKEVSEGSMDKIKNLSR